MVQGTIAIGTFMTILLGTALWIAAQIAAVAGVTLLGLSGGWTLWRRHRR